MLFGRFPSICALHMMIYILDAFLQFGIIALLIIFQPELRRVLEQIGRSGIGSKYLSIPILNKEPEDVEKQQRKCINAVVDAMASLQKQKMGALVVFERQTKLGEIIETVRSSMPNLQRLSLEISFLTKPRCTMGQ